MKKVLLVIGITCMLMSCGQGSTEEVEVVDSTAVVEEVIEMVMEEAVEVDTTVVEVVE